MTLRLLTGASLCAACYLLTGCGQDPQAKPDHTLPPQAKVVEVPDTNVISLDHPERFETVAAAERPFIDELNVNGSIAPDVGLSVPVLSLAGGRVVEIRARLGDHVEKGQVLLRIDSPDVSSAISTFRAAGADEVLARKQLERAQLLLDKGAIAAKDLEVVQDAAEKARIATSTAEQQLRLLGADPAHPSPVIDVKSPITGYVVEQNISAGTAVKSTDNSPNLFTIADLSRVWLICDVFENNLAQVHLGDSADIRLNAYPDRVLKGRVNNIGAVLDPNLHSAKVRLEIANPGGLLRVGMFATVTFHSSTGHMRVYIPSSAAIRLHDRDWVFLKTDATHFRRKEIQLGQSAGDNTEEVLSGLSAGDRIVRRALQLESAVAAQ
ncbi:MAG TPA: efflux RND transporter periplasmic adaptor subunit [Bryobacteraceae bacterium]|nr:efflux RND transporter periplasmic adaptor subunit [Bryobacteraceae bacterium]